MTYEFIKLDSIKEMIRRITKICVLRYRKEDLCEEIDGGLYRCFDGYNQWIVTLYTLEESFIRVEELEYIDFLNHLKKYITTLIPPGCSLLTVSSIRPINVDKYLSSIGHKLQMKLIELESDKSNTRLRDTIERLIEIRKRILSGIIPVETSNLIAVICRDAEINKTLLKRIPHVAKQVLGVTLRSVSDMRKAIEVINFCGTKAQI